MYKVSGPRKKVDLLTAEIKDLQKYLFIEYNTRAEINIADNQVTILAHKGDAKAIKNRLKKYKLLSKYELNVCCYCYHI